MTRASQQHKRAVHGMDSSGKGISVSKSAGTNTSAATAYVSGTFDTDDTVELGVEITTLATGAKTRQIDSVYAAVADGVDADTMAAGLAAVINAIANITASAVTTNVITITPGAGYIVNLIDARSRRK